MPIVPHHQPTPVVQRVKGGQYVMPSWVSESWLKEHGRYELEWFS
jgi:hypothetical protein